MSLKAKSVVRISVALASLIGLLALIGFSATGALPEPGPSDVSLTASPVQEPNGRWSMRFELSYSGEKALLISERSLPWKSPGELLLVAVPLNGGRNLSTAPQSIRSGLAAATLSLNPGDSLSGSVDVSSHFPGLAAAIRETDVMVFWSHQIPEASALPRLAGGVLLPRQR